MSHFIPHDAPTFNGQARATCGRLAPLEDHDVEPDCEECQEHLENDRRLSTICNGCGSYAAFCRCDEAYERMEAP